MRYANGSFTIVTHYDSDDNGNINFYMQQSKQKSIFVSCTRRLHRYSYELQDTFRARSVEIKIQTHTHTQTHHIFSTFSAYQLTMNAGQTHQVTDKRD